LKDSTDPPKIGIALGSGASRGWSHIGVLKALLAAGITPDIVCGSSVGAMVGGAYLAGNIDKLQNWVLSASRTDVLRFFSFRLAGSGFVDIERLDWFLHSFVAADLFIEQLGKPYAAVCTDQASGAEVLLCEGALADAIRASMAMPGLFPAQYCNQQWLVDGGLVNPVPITACRSLGADIVIGVNLNADILNKSHDKSTGLLSTISNTINIFQNQITQSRLEADPADILIEPKLGDIGMFEFERAADAIREGESCVQNAQDLIAKYIAAWPGV
jgi:NTE family protein